MDFFEIDALAAILADTNDAVIGAVAVVDAVVAEAEWQDAAMADQFADWKANGPY